MIKLIIILALIVGLSFLPELTVQKIFHIVIIAAVVCWLIDWSGILNGLK